jgi:catalase
MSIKFHLQAGSETDILAHCFNGFPAPSADDFKAFLLALGASGPGASKPTPLDVYLAAHSVAKTFLEF